jgi:hypothetical protein
MDASNLDKAREDLRVREGVYKKNSGRDIGSWSAGHADASPPKLILDLPQWAKARSIDAVVWTALGPKFDDNHDAPTVQQVINHLGGLKARMREEAERYVRYAPAQVDTAYRREIESTLHWTPLTPP